MKNSKIKIIAISILSLILLIFISFNTLVLTSCSSGPEDLKPENIINQIFPNIWVLIAQVVASAILFLVILFLIWKPTNNMLEKRKKLIANEIEDAKEMKSKAEIELNNAKEKAKLIIEQSYSVSRSMISSAKTEAKLQTEQMINSTNELLNREKIKIKNDAEKEILDTIFKTTEILLKKEISKKDNEKLVKDFIKELSTNE